MMMYSRGPQQQRPPPRAGAAAGTAATTGAAGAGMMMSQQQQQQSSFETAFEECKQVFFEEVVGFVNADGGGQVGASTHDMRNPQHRQQILHNLEAKLNPHVFRYSICSCGNTINNSNTNGGNGGDNNDNDDPTRLMHEEAMMLMVLIKLFKQNSKLRVSTIVESLRRTFLIGIDENEEGSNADTSSRQLTIDSPLLHHMINIHAFKYDFEVIAMTSSLDNNNVTGILGLYTHLRKAYLRDRSEQREQREQEENTNRNSTSNKRRRIDKSSAFSSSDDSNEFWYWNVLIAYVVSSLAYDSLSVDSTNTISIKEFKLLVQKLTRGIFPYMSGSFYREPALALYYFDLLLTTQSSADHRREQQIKIDGLTLPYVTELLIAKDCNVLDVLHSMAYYPSVDVAVTFVQNKIAAACEMNNIVLTAECREKIMHYFRYRYSNYLVDKQPAPASASQQQQPRAMVGNKRRRPDDDDDNNDSSEQPLWDDLSLSTKLRDCHPAYALLAQVQYYCDCQRYFNQKHNNLVASGFNYLSNACSLASKMSKSSNLHRNAKEEAYRIIFRHLLISGYAFHSTIQHNNHNAIINSSNHDIGDELKSTLLYTLLPFTGQYGMDILAQGYSGLYLEVEAMHQKGYATAEECRYVQKGCEQTLLRLLWSMHGQYNLRDPVLIKLCSYFPKLEPVTVQFQTNNDAEVWALKFLREDNSVPASLRTTGTSPPPPLGPDLDTLLNRPIIAEQERQQELCIRQEQQQRRQLLLQQQQQEQEQEVAEVDEGEPEAEVAAADIAGPPSPAAAATAAAADTDDGSRDVSEMSGVVEELQEEEEEVADDDDVGSPESSQQQQQRPDVGAVAAGNAHDPLVLGSSSEEEVDEEEQLQEAAEDDEHFGEEEDEVVVLDHSDEEEEEEGDGDESSRSDHHLHPREDEDEEDDDYGDGGDHRRIRFPMSEARRRQLEEEMREEEERHLEHEEEEGKEDADVAAELDRDHHRSFVGAGDDEQQHSAASTHEDEETDSDGDEVLVVESASPERHGNDGEQHIAVRAAVQEEVVASEPEEAEPTHPTEEEQAGYDAEDSQGHSDEEDERPKSRGGSVAQSPASNQTTSPESSVRVEPPVQTATSQVDEGYEAEDQGVHVDKEDSSGKPSKKKKVVIQEPSKKEEEQEGYEAEESQGHTEEEDELPARSQSEGDIVQSPDSIQQPVQMATTSPESSNRVEPPTQTATSQLDADGYEAEDSHGQGLTDEEKRPAPIKLEQSSPPQVETGYEAEDSQGHTEEDEEVEMQTEDEREEEKKRRRQQQQQQQQDQQNRGSPTEEGTPKLDDKRVPERSLSDMSAADERTEVDQEGGDTGHEETDVAMDLETPLASQQQQFNPLVLSGNRTSMLGQFATAAQDQQVVARGASPRRRSRGADNQTGRGISRSINTGMAVAGGSFSRSASLESTGGTDGEGDSITGAAVVDHVPGDLSKELEEEERAVAAEEKQEKEAQPDKKPAATEESSSPEQAEVKPDAQSPVQDEEPAPVAMGVSSPVAAAEEATPMGIDEKTTREEKTIPQSAQQAPPSGQQAPDEPEGEEEEDNEQHASASEHAASVEVENEPKPEAVSKPSDSVGSPTSQTLTNVDIAGRSPGVSSLGSPPTSRRSGKEAGGQSSSFQPVVEADGAEDEGEEEQELSSEGGPPGTPLYKLPGARKRGGLSSLKKEDDGSYHKPKGRVPVGYEWDKVKGAWKWTEQPEGYVWDGDETKGDWRKKGATPEDAEAQASADADSEEATPMETDEKVEALGDQRASEEPESKEEEHHTEEGSEKGGDEKLESGSEGDEDESEEERELSSEGEGPPGTPLYKLPGARKRGGLSSLKKEDDGSYHKPKGRVPEGYEWEALIGAWKLIEQPEGYVWDGDETKGKWRKKGETPGDEAEEEPSSSDDEAKKPAATPRRQTRSSGGTSSGRRTRSGGAAISIASKKKPPRPRRPSSSAAAAAALSAPPRQTRSRTGSTGDDGDARVASSSTPAARRRTTRSSPSQSAVAGLPPRSTRRSRRGSHSAAGGDDDDGNSVATGPSTPSRRSTRRRTPRKWSS